jgi:hypothetical protein
VQWPKYERESVGEKNIVMEIHNVKCVLYFPNNLEIS